MSAKTICFTGHRPHKLKPDAVQWINEALRRAVSRAIERGFTRFISGGALGVDQWAARVVLEFRATHKLQLFIARPFPKQGAMWAPQGQKWYRVMLQLADQVFNVSPQSCDGAYYKRNMVMVDRAAAVIAVWDGSPGGTAHTVSYALKTGCPVFAINPKLRIEKWVNEFG